MSAIQQQLMTRLYGEDVWQGFEPSGEVTEVQGWNGNHPSLSRLTSQTKGKVVIDVGVWKGQSTITMARTLRDNDLDGVVLAVDTFLGSPEHWHGANARFSRRHGHPDLYDIFMNNVARAGLTGYVIPVPQTSTNAALILKRRGIRASIVHIDAAHEYRDVLNDARDFWAIVENDGYLIGDDYSPSWPGVIQGANEFATEIGRPLDVELPKWIVRKSPPL